MYNKIRKKVEAYELFVRIDLIFGMTLTIDTNELFNNAITQNDTGLKIE